MDTKRLQEIKDNYLLHGAEEWTNEEDVVTEEVIKELITAYETSQQQLAEAEAETKRWMEERDHYFDLYDVLTMEASMSQVETRGLEIANPTVMMEISTLRAQLAEAEAEVERLQIQNGAKVGEIYNLRGEVERLRGEGKELTGQEIKDKYFPNQTWEELRCKVDNLFDKQT